MVVVVALPRRIAYVPEPTGLVTIAGAEVVPVMVGPHEAVAPDSNPLSSAIWAWLRMSPSNWDMTLPLESVGPLMVKVPVPFTPAGTVRVNAPWTRFGSGT